MERLYGCSSKREICSKTTSYKDDIFIDVPMTIFNAVWIVIFKPFTFELGGLVKHGSSSYKLTFERYYWTRGTAQATTFSIPYKVIDTLVMLYGRETPSGAFYENFLNDSQCFSLFK